MNENFGFRLFFFFFSFARSFVVHLRLFALECDNELSSNNEVANSRCFFFSYFVVEKFRRESNSPQTAEAEASGRTQYKSASANKVIKCFNQMPFCVPVPLAMWLYRSVALSHVSCIVQPAHQCPMHAKCGLSSLSKRKFENNVAAAQRSESV